MNNPGLKDNSVFQKQVVPLEEVVWFQEGPGIRNYQYTTQGVKLLNVANLHDEMLDTSNTERYISTAEAYGKYRHFLVDPGDLIIASSGIKVDYFDQKMGFAHEEQLPLCMNTSTIRFKVVDRSRTDIRYFMYFLKSNQFKKQLERHITGSAQLNFGPSHLKKMHVALPEIPEQKRVIKKLDSAHCHILQLNRVLDELNNLVKSRFPQKEVAA